MFSISELCIVMDKDKRSDLDKLGSLLLSKQKYKHSSKYKDKKRFEDKVFGVGFRDVGCSIGECKLLYRLNKPFVDKVFVGDVRLELCVVEKLCGEYGFVVERNGKYAVRQHK